MGPYPLERLERGLMPDLSKLSEMSPLSFHRPKAPDNITNAMGEYQAMLDAIRDGLVNRTKAEIPSDPLKRSQHIKGFGYFNDAAMIGICNLPASAILDGPIINSDVARLAQALRTRQTRTLASGIDLIMADLKD